MQPLAIIALLAACQIPVVLSWNPLNITDCSCAPLLTNKNVYCQNSWVTRMKVIRQISEEDVGFPVRPSKLGIRDAEYFTVQHSQVFKGNPDELPNAVMVETRQCAPSLRVGTEYLAAGSTTCVQRNQCVGFMTLCDQLIYGSSSNFNFPAGHYVEWRQVTPAMRDELQWLQQNAVDAGCWLNFDNSNVAPIH